MSLNLKPEVLHLQTKDITKLGINKLLILIQLNKVVRNMKTTLYIKPTDKTNTNKNRKAIIYIYIDQEIHGS